MVCIRNAISSGSIEQLREAGEALLESPDVKKYDSNPGRVSGRFVWTRINWPINDTIKQFLTSGAVPEIARSLLDARKCI